MKTLLLLSILIPAPACVVPNETLSDVPPQGQAVEAVFVRPSADVWHDVDPVAAREASFGKIVPVVDAFPWDDRLVEKLPVAVMGPVTPAPHAPNLSADVVDADPLAARGWR